MLGDHGRREHVVPLVNQVLATMVIDDVLPAYDANRVEHVTVGAEPVRVYANLLEVDLMQARRLLTWLGIEPHIRHKGDQHGSHLGRILWVVERTISWIKGLRRMRIRYDRSVTTINAWTSLAAAVVCFHILCDVIA